MRTVMASLAVTVAGMAALAQGPAHSPEVSADRRVTFRMLAPNAKEVTVTGDAGKLAMQKGDGGVWSVTTPQLEPDVYAYTYLVDGATVLDPGNPLRKPAFMAGGQSLVRVPGPVAWEPTDVPHGAIARHFYKSIVVGDDRDFYVYTPPGYDPRGSVSYPALYLLHGHGDEAAGWTSTGSANVILDNLIAQRKARPMIMVNPLGYGSPEMMTALATGRGGGPHFMEKNVENFATALIEEVMPLVEKHYRVSKKPEERAIAGLSMGGAQALFAGLNHPERFRWIGAFSGGLMMWSNAWWSNPGPPAPLDADVFPRIFPALDAKSNSLIKLLWISYGLEERAVTTMNRQFKEYLQSKGIAFKYREHSGGHTWSSWRRDLVEFAPMLFQNEGK